MGDSELLPLLAEVLAPVLGPVDIDDLVPLTGGASRETWSFDAVAADGELIPLILQRNRGGTSLGIPFLVEDQLLGAAVRAGVPSPHVVADSHACAVLGDARITLRIEGESLAPRIVRSDELSEARAALPQQLAEALAAIHSIHPDDVDGLIYEDPLQQIRSGLDELAVVSPAFELALRWLERHRPDNARHTVVHGDFRMGNLLVDSSGLCAVLDWELAHLGDPIEDLGWLCVRAWRFGGDRVVGGFGDLVDLLPAYRQASGSDVSEEHVRWWIVAGTLRWGLICAVQAHRHLDGHIRSVELATIGRRVAENEHDLLDLLGVPASPPEAPLPIVDHGRPTALELVTAVREHLVEHVMPKLSRSDAFSTRVAANALATVERELSANPSPELGVDDVSLAERIRSGAEITGDDLADLRAAVSARVAVANPKWAPQVG